MPNLHQNPGTLLYMLALCNLDVTDCPFASSFHPPASCPRTRSICQQLTLLCPPLLPKDYRRQLAALEPLCDRLMLLASRPLLPACLFGQTPAMLWNQSRCRWPPTRGTGCFNCLRRSLPVCNRNTITDVLHLSYTDRDHLTMPRHTSATPLTYCTWPPVNDACSFPPDDMLLDNKTRYEDFRLNQLWLLVQR